MDKKKMRKAVFWAMMLITAVTVTPFYMAALEGQWNAEGFIAVLAVVGTLAIACRWDE